MKGIKTIFRRVSARSLLIPAIMIGSFSATANASETDSTAVLQNIQSKLPNTTFVSIEPSIFDEFYVVTTGDGRRILFREDGKHMFVGVVFDINTGEMVYGAGFMNPVTQGGY